MRFTTAEQQRFVRHVAGCHVSWALTSQCMLKQYEHTWFTCALAGTWSAKDTKSAYYEPKIDQEQAWRHIAFSSGEKEQFHQKRAISSFHHPSANVPQSSGLCSHWYMQVARRE
jgi:hypothetical protein